MYIYTNGKYHLILLDTFTFLKPKSPTKDHPDVLQTNISLVNVRLMNQYLM